MTRFRLVDRSDWRLEESLGPRRARLLNVPAPEDLLESVFVESFEASQQKLLALQWQESCESPGYFRLVGQIPLSPVTFDQLFNGRSGYRAQYYLSPEEGVLFNRALMDGLWIAVVAAYNVAPISADLKLLESSLSSPHAKIWVYGETDAFDEAIPETLNPPRWVSNNATRGRRAPLPDHYSIDIKGAFIEPYTRQIFVDKLKLDRPCDLFNRGYT